MKKICFFMNSPFTLGGEQRVVTILANYLVKQSYEVYFLLTDKNNKVDYAAYNLNKSVKLIFLPEYNKFFNKFIRKIVRKSSNYNYKTGRFKNNLKYLKSVYCNHIDEKILLEKISHYHFNYIIGVASNYYGILSILKPHLANTKVIAWQHSCFEAYFKTKGRRFYNQDLFLNYMFDNIDYYITQTSDDKNKIIKNYKYYPIVINNPNSFITEKISRFDNKNFVAVGRFDFVKGFDQLIEAFNIFSKKNKEWKLLLVGNGPERVKYEKLIHKYNLEDRILLIGETNDISKVYLNSSIYLMTSLWEGWGMVVTEAMAYGLPVISYNLPSSIEIFGDSDCGILVEKGNIQKFAESMELIANNQKLMKQMSKKGLTQVKKFDINSIGRKWISLFEGEVSNDEN